MKPDYKNWIPKGMLVSLIAGTVLSFTLLLVFGVFGVCVSGKLRVVLGEVFGIAFVVCAKYTQWCVYAYRVFSYDGERKLSKQIIDGTAEHITLPEGGVGLDIGCGSGALTIACAKRNPQGKMVGIDRSGKDKQQLLLETLRMLKKGGTFAIYDLMSPRRYGDMQAFVQKLMDMGYERVELMDTADGSFMTPKEAGRLMLCGSTLLVGRK